MLWKLGIMGLKASDGIIIKDNSYPAGTYLLKVNNRNTKTKVILSETLIKLTVKPLSANFTEWSNTLEQLVNKLRTNCLRVLDHFVGLALKELRELCGKENGLNKALIK